MGYQIKVTYPDGSTHIRKQVYKSKVNAEVKAKWFRDHLKPEVKVVRSH